MIWPTVQACHNEALLWQPQEQHRALSQGSFDGRMRTNLYSASADRQTHRETTIASFRRAAAAGVSFVEFDVQVEHRA